MMKLSAFADEISPELDEQIKVCRENQITHFELRGVYGKNVLEFDGALRREIKSKLHDNGLGVACIGSPIGKVSIDQPWQTHFDRFKIAIDAAEFFERTLKRLDEKAKELGRPRVAGEVSKWVQGELFGAMNRDGIGFADSPVTSEQMAVLLWLMFDNDINQTIAKDILKIIWVERGADPRAIVEARGMKQVTDTGAIEMIVDDIIAKNPDKVADLKTNPKALGWFVGQVLKASGGKANPQSVNEILKAKLGL